MTSVQLKKDYIPGLGDSVDLLLLGAGWDKDRARELRGTPTFLNGTQQLTTALVSPCTYTTFYLGAATSNTGSKVPSAWSRFNLQSTEGARQPVFESWFTCAYGLDRDKLEELNFLITSSDPIQGGKGSSIVRLTFIQSTRSLMEGHTG
jgi:DNA ligase-4